MSPVSIVSEQPKPKLRIEDDIDALMKRRGATTPDLERLARIARSMQQLEWMLVRQKRRPEDDPSRK